MKFVFSKKSFFLASSFFIATLFLSGCASSKNKIPEISTLALLSHDSNLYIGVPVKYHKDLVCDLISSQTGLSKKNAETVAGRIVNLYAGIGSISDSKRIEISADGSFPSIAVDYALSEQNGWSKKDYTARSSEEALTAGYPNKFKYYMNMGIAYKVSFPTTKELLVSKKLAPMFENYAVRYDASLLQYNLFVNLDENDSQDILFYSSNPSSFVKNLIGDLAKGWFVSLYGKLSNKGSDYSLEGTLELADKNRKTVAMSLMAIAGIPVKSIDDTTIQIDGFKITRDRIKKLIAGGGL